MDGYSGEDCHYFVQIEGHNNDKYCVYVETSDGWYLSLDRVFKYYTCACKYADKMNKTRNNAIISFGK